MTAPCRTPPEGSGAPRIRRLPEHVVSRIAAGEVVERPASVLKELIENSLDAGASRVQIESAGAGRELLRVADDGRGMGPEDCRLAFERHATSKIASAEDLERLETFGFRGEALYSVAAVSRVALTSCPAGSRQGRRVEAEAGRLTLEREAPPVAGTVIEVKGLFFNTPARAKFLKSDASERGHLLRVVEEAALANPGVAFAYVSEGREALRAGPGPGGGDWSRSLAARVNEVLGDSLGGDLETVIEAFLLPAPGASARPPASAAKSPAGAGAQGAPAAGAQAGAGEPPPRGRLCAFVARPEHLKAARGLQYFFINRRPVTSRVLQQALYRAYEPFRAAGRHPAAVVFLELPPDQFDVNVHPAKREVRLRAESAVFQALSGAISSALLKSRGIATLSGPSLLREPRARYRAAPGPAGTRRGFGHAELPMPGVAGASGRAPAAGKGHSGSDASPAEPAAGSRGAASGGPSTGGGAPAWYAPPFKFLGDIERAYLVFDASGGLLLVDQHAAQERILYERYLGELESGKVRSQRLMLPVPVELPASQVEAVLSRAEALERAGFEVQAFSRKTLQVTTAPAVLARAGDLLEMIHRLLGTFDSERAVLADVRRHAAATVACKAAVKAHDPLSAAEAAQLLEDLRDCRDGTSCPHGRPALLILTRDELARRFKRPGAAPL